MDPISASGESRAVALARRVLRIEADAVLALGARIGEEFERAVEIILARHGRVIVTGVGKSGHIGRKLAATLASTGTPAYFVHAAEAAHGDLGMITPEDVVIALSNSGSSEELLTIVPLVKRQGAKLIAITGRPESALALQADVHLEADISATDGNKNGFGKGEWIPYLTINYTLVNKDTGEKQSGTFMPMVASDGPHYGANIKMAGVGNYTVTYQIEPPPKAGMHRHTDKETGVARWWKPIEVKFDFKYVGLK